MLPTGAAQLFAKIEDHFLVPETLFIEVRLGIQPSPEINFMYISRHTLNNVIRVPPNRS